MGFGTTMLILCSFEVEMILSDDSGKCDKKGL